MDVAGGAGGGGVDVPEARGWLVDVRGWTENTALSTLSKGLHMAAAAAAAIMAVGGSGVDVAAL